MNDAQKTAYDLVKEAICGSVRFVPVRYNAIKVRTPFLDWVGDNLSIYITEDGEITDGEKTYNQIKAMRVFGEFQELIKESDYFDDFNLNLVGHGSLEPKYLESPDDIVRYIQGVARLPMLFEVNPLEDKEDRFPTTVRNTTMELLMKEYSDRVDAFNWAYKLSHPFLITTRSGIKIHSDMCPINKNKNVQIIGMVNSERSAQDAHVSSKLYNSLYWKKYNRDAKTIVVVFDLSKYSDDSQSGIIEEADPLIQYKDGKMAERKLVAEIAEA
jgi:hypothetical protein